MARALDVVHQGRALGREQAGPGADARHGIGSRTRTGPTGLLPAESAALMNDIQRFAIEKMLGIPVIVHEESTGGYCARGRPCSRRRSGSRRRGTRSSWARSLT